METRSAKKRRLMNFHNDPSTAVDHISDLPDDVLNLILSLLTIRDVAKTSVLSRRWRSLWRTYPVLDFSYLFNVDNSSLMSSIRKNAASFFDFIPRILNLREKHSYIRLLRIRAILSFSRLNSFLRCAIRHNIQELDVEVATKDYFNFPRSLLGCNSLKVFKLRSLRPGFRLLPSSVMATGFQFLHSLSLVFFVCCDQPSLLDMFSESSFPFLKRLNLKKCLGLKHLKISCPALEELNLEECLVLQSLELRALRLKTFRIAGCFESYSKGSVKFATPKLRTLVMARNAIVKEFVVENLVSLHDARVSLRHDDFTSGIPQNLSKLLSGISHSQSLVFDCPSIRSLFKKYYFDLPAFNNLKSLVLLLFNFTNESAPGLAKVFKCCPILETLAIKKSISFESKDLGKKLWKMTASEEEQFWESQIRSLQSFLDHLKFVKFHDFLECEKELTLVKFLLKHGKGLQEMSLYQPYTKESKRQKLRSQMMGFSWASPNAKLTIH